MSLIVTSASAKLWQNRLPVVATNRNPGRPASRNAVQRIRLPVVSGFRRLPWVLPWGRPSTTTRLPAAISGVVQSIQSTYRVGSETIEGKMVRGTEDKGRSEAIAKAGCAVGGIHARREAAIDAVKLIFYRIDGTSMDPKDKHESEWLGGSGGTGSNSVEFHGNYIVGISGTFQNVTSIRFRVGRP